MSDERKSLIPELPPLTLEALEEEIFTASDKAQFAWESAFVSRFLVSNLLLALHQARVLDGHSLLSEFRSRVQAQSEEVLQPSDRRALLEALEELQQLLLAQPAGPGVH